MSAYKHSENRSISKTLSLHATEQLVQDTMKLFLSLQGGGI